MSIQTPSAPQIRAALALLEWDNRALARASGVSVDTVQNSRKGHHAQQAATLTKIRRAFEREGIEFFEHNGIRQRTETFEIFEGPERFNDFTDFLYARLKAFGGDVCISATDERLFARYRANHELHRQRMKELVDAGNVTVRIIASESRFVSDYAQYRHIPVEGNAAPTSFYAFGDCLALISFEHEPAPYVALHKGSPFAEAFRRSFDLEWQHAQEPPRK